jgi:hypothetical protein
LCLWQFIIIILVTPTGDAEMPGLQYLVFTMVHAVAVEWPFQFALSTFCRDTHAKQRFLWSSGCPFRCVGCRGVCCLASHNIRFWQYAKEVEMCCRYFVENCFFNLVNWSLVANMNSFKHMLKYDHCFSVCLVGCFRKTCRTVYNTCDVILNNVRLPLNT